MHGKSIRIPGPQDLRARRVVHRDPVPGEAGGGGSAGTSMRRRTDRHETVGVESDSGGDVHERRYHTDTGPAPAEPDVPCGEKEYPSWVYAL